MHEIDTLYREHVQVLFAYGSNLGFSRETTKDVIHDIFYKICSDKLVLSSIINKRSYLLRALKNRLFDIYKQTREKADLPTDSTYHEIPFTVNVTIEDKLIQAEDKELILTQVKKLLEKLTHRQREIIYLRHSQELSYEEIAVLMNITVPATRKLYHKAITALRKQTSIPLLLLF